MSKPDLDTKVRELMDACRPDSDDISEPEMSALADLLSQDSAAREIFARSENLDRSIGKAFRDVQPPPGLAARLLAAAVGEDELTRTDSDGQSAEQVSAASRAAQTHSKRTSRRRWIALAGTLAASLVVAVYAAVVLNQADDPISHLTVADMAIAWLDDAQQGDWDGVKKPPTDSYPLASSINVDADPGSIKQWQFIRTDYGKAAVYDLTPPGDKFVYLFTIRTGEQFSAPQLLPLQPARNTQGVSIGVSYHDGILHVLVVDGDERRYSEFIQERLPVI